MNIEENEECLNNENDYGESNLDHHGEESEKSEENDSEKNESEEMQCSEGEERFEMLKYLYFLRNQPKIQRTRLVEYSSFYHV
jgi:hypothetical protein